MSTWLGKEAFLLTKAVKFNSNIYFVAITCCVEMFAFREMVNFGLIAFK